MIEFCKAYKVGDQTFATLEQAQEFELVGLIVSIHAKNDNELAGELVKHADKVIDILSTKASSRPKARKANGGTKKRKAGVDVSKLPDFPSGCVQTWTNAVESKRRGDKPWRR